MFSRASRPCCSSRERAHAHRHALPAILSICQRACCHNNIRDRIRGSCWLPVTRNFFITRSEHFYSAFVGMGNLMEIDVIVPRTSCNMKIIITFSSEFLSGLVVRYNGLIYRLNMIDGLARVARNRGYESRLNDSVIFFSEFRFCVLCSRVAYFSICRVKFTD